MTWYADSSALVKLVVAEAESGALREWLDEEDIYLASSEIALVEVVRAARAVDPAAVASARSVLATISLVQFDQFVSTTAAILDPGVLRSLDAIHLASALRLGAFSAGVVTYDRRMLSAASGLGFAVNSPAY